MTLSHSIRMMLSLMQFPSNYYYEKHGNADALIEMSELCGTALSKLDNISLREFSVGTGTLN